MMVKVREDMTGWKMWEHGVPDSRITVIKQVEDYISPSGVHLAQWLCQCSCGSEPIIILGNSLKSKNTKSCGCLSTESVSKRLKKYNKYDLSGEYGIGWTSNTNKEFYFDLKHYDKIKDYCWYETKQGNTSRLQTSDPETHKVIRMHILLGYKNWDHIDRNELNNLESNLRPCTSQENVRNSTKRLNTTSDVIGVCFDKSRSQWMAYIHTDKHKSKTLGRFTNLSDAIKARLQAEVKYFGKFAPQIHLFEKYGIVYKEDNTQ